MPDFDDKDLTIVATLVLGLFAMFCLGEEAGNIVGQIVTGMFGVAVGKNMK